MALDGLVLHQITKQLQELTPTKINKIQQISNDEIIFVLRSNQENYKLMISCHSTYNRIHITKRDYKTVEIPNSFLMVLRKYIDRSIIKTIEQIGLDRILKLTLQVKNELGDYHEYALYVELMGKYANLILVNDENRIIDALKRIPTFENNTRTIHPGAQFQLPKAHEDKQDPYRNTEVNLEESLVKQFHGFSPLLSDEVLYRIRKGEDFETIMREISLSQSLFLYDEKGKTLFHLLELTHLNAISKKYELMEAMDQLYFEKEEKVRIKQQNGDIYKTVRHEIKKNKKKILKLEHTMEDALDLDKYRIHGDLLYAYPQHYEKHIKSITLEDFSDNQEITIPLDDKISVKQNAKKFYQKYKKSKTAQIEVAKQLELTHTTIAYFENIESQLDKANFEDAIEIKEELAQHGFMKKTKVRIRKKKANIPHFVTLEVDETPIFIGKNNLQNDYITFKHAHRDDTWFHVKDMHGSHVVVKGDNPSDEIIRIAAKFAAYYSQGKESSSVPVNYCLIRQLKKPNKANLGFVTLTSYKTIYIDPVESEIEDLLQTYEKR